MGEIPDYATIPMPLLTIFGDVFFDVLETLQLWVWTLVTSSFR